MFDKNNIIRGYKDVAMTVNATGGDVIDLLGVLIAHQAMAAEVDVDLLLTHIIKSTHMAAEKFDAED